MVQADLVLLGGKIGTVDREFRFAEAVAVKDGWITYVGSDEEARRRIGPHTRVIDLGGRLVLPGAHDSHLHAAFAGLALADDFVDVNDEIVTDLKEMNRRLAAAAAARPNGAWIIGTGFKKDLLRECAERGTSVTRWDIDPATPEHPVMLTDGGLHRMLLNTRALKLCGITKDTPDWAPEVGKIVRNADGEPTGLLEDFGGQAVAGLYAHHCSDEELEACILRMQRHLNTLGITSHTDIVGVGGDDLFAGTCGARVIEAYERLSRAGRLTARVSIEVLPGMHGVQSYRDITEGLHKTKLPAFSDRNWVRADAVKIFGDDAWKRDDDTGSDRGYCYFPGATDEEQAEELARTIIEVHRLGWQMGIHLTGGKAIDTAVAAFAEAMERYPRRNPRHFVIHGSELTRAGAEQCVRYGIGLSVQSVGGYRFAGKCTDVYTPEERAGVQDLQGFTDLGLVVAQGSDGPALPMSWLMGLQFLVSRVNRYGEPCHTDLCCNLKDAIRMYTINGAHQEHMEELIGSIEIGKLADLQVLDRDLFETDPSDYGQARVLMTFCGGTLVYAAE